MLKKDAELASHNWFLERKRGQPEALKGGATHDKAIIVHDDAIDGDVEMLPRDVPPHGDSLSWCFYLLCDLNDLPSCRVSVRYFAAAAAKKFDVSKEAFIQSVQFTLCAKPHDST